MQRHPRHSRSRLPAKAQLCGNILLKRLERIGIVFERSNVEAIGAGACVPGVLPAQANPVEVVLRVSVQDSRRDHVERFTKEFAPLVTSGTPGVTGYTTGRPAVAKCSPTGPPLCRRT